MRIIFIILVNFVFSTSVFAFVAKSDTVLTTVISIPYFNNVIQTSEGKIYTGSDDGIYEWNGIGFKKYNNESGYVTVNKENNLVISPFGLKNYENRTYNYLLPFVLDKTESFHAGTSDYFYIVAGGRIYIYTIEPYKIEYFNHSIRTISNRFLGTYSGIYADGKKVNYPPTIDGYIREIGDTTFFCYGGLRILTSKDTLDYSSSIDLTRIINNINIGTVYDILYFKPTNKYYLASTKGLFEIAPDFKKALLVYKNETNEPTVLIHPNNMNSVTTYNVIHFGVGNQLINYNPFSKIAETIATFKSNIKSGLFYNRNYYILTKYELYSASKNGVVEQLETFIEPHTLLSITDKELLIGTNFGLYHYNLDTKKKNILIKGVEFNRYALAMINNSIYAGSINGLYIIAKDQVNKIIQDGIVNLQNRTDNRNVYYLMTLSLLVILTLITVLFLLKKKLNTAVKYNNTESLKNTLNKFVIETYINEHISTVSIKQINEHFDINLRKLYALTYPEKPGTIISNMRLQLLQEMRSKDATIQEIAKATGLSISYIRKIRK